MSNIPMDPKRKRFCKEYLTDFNATRAATAAGYAEGSAHVQGHKLLARDDVRAYIKKINDRVNDKLDLTREKVIAEMARIGLYDVRKVFNKDRGLIDITKIDDETAAAIESIEVIANTAQGETIDYTHKIKMAKKMPALKALGEHFNIFEDHQNSGGGEIHVHLDEKASKL